METLQLPLYARDLGWALAKFGFTVIALPLVPVFLFGLSLPSTIALMTSTFIIEYGAAAVGVGLDLNPFFVLFVLLCIAAGVTMLLFDIFILVGMHSARVGKFLKKASERAGQSKIISKYGIYGLIPCVMTLGFYACPPIAWVLGWDRTRSFIVIMVGYFAVSVATILASIGILKLFFP